MATFARFFLTAALAIIGVIFAGSELKAGTYLWPVEGYHSLTGTFGEFRYTHFHTGIDISTNGAIGAPLRAIDDGFVYRIKTSPGGYGRAIYIRLQDGNLAVYGHLSRFTPSLTQRVREEHHRLSNYTIDYYPQAADFPVRRGDIIGYSGDTGGVSPHLHFELRTAENRPINPLPHLDAIPFDGTEPRITAVALNPMGIDSTVEGSWRTRTYATKWNKTKKAYTIPGPIRIWGDCGVEVSAHDLSPRGYHTGVYALDLGLNDQPVSALRYDTVTYDEYRDNYVLVNRRLYLDLKKSFQRFYHQDSAVLPFYDIPEETSGILTSSRPGLPGSLKQGLNTVKIVAEDHAKKQRALHFQLLVEEPFYRKEGSCSASSVSSTSTENNVIIVDSSVLLVEDFVVVEATVAGPVTESVHCLFRQPGVEEAVIPLYFRSPNTLAGRHAPRPHHDGVATVSLIATSLDGKKHEATHEVILQTVSPDKGGTVASNDGVVSVTFKPGHVPYTILPQVSSGPVTKPPKFLKPVSNAYRFTPLDVSFRGKGTLAMKLKGERSQQVALFKRDKGPWRYLARVEDMGDNKIVSSIPHFSEYALFRDTYAPTIKISAPAHDASLKKDGKPFFARVGDKGTGIDSYSTAMLLDGKKVPAEYIPNKRKLYYEPFYPLAPGEHTLAVVAVDWVGNRTEKSVTFTVGE